MTIRLAWARLLKGLGLGAPGPLAAAPAQPQRERPAADAAIPSGYAPDAEQEELSTRAVPSPGAELVARALRGEVRVKEAQLCLMRLGADGRLADQGSLRETARLEAENGRRFDDAPYKLEAVRGHDAFVARMRAAEAEIGVAHPERLRALEAARASVGRVLRETGFFDDVGPSGVGPLLQYDANQYTEYTPLWGGEYNRQLYSYDTLLMHARAFEAWNHNPAAKRAVNLLAQYTLSRRVKASSKKDAVLDAWGKFERRWQVYSNMSKFWIRERLIFGELFLHLPTMRTLDPSSIWEIVTDLEDMSRVYYYQQMYSTAYQMYPGIAVPGVPGSGQTKAVEYVIRQIPWDQVLHVKGECVSNEKRGRSILFPILGWLKRIKDLYNAEVIGAWMRACFIWDDTIDGGPADIAAHLSAYSQMPLAGTMFAHNKAIERKVLAPQTASSGAGAGATVANEILAFIATSVGIPKEHFNLVAQGGGTRANALVSSEPFTKVIEELQAEFEDLLKKLAAIACAEAGVDYEDGDIEFIFPSVTKDTTTETVTNIAKGQQFGWWSQETAAAMGAAELNITGYDYDEEQATIKEEKEQALMDAATTLPPRDGQLGPTSGGGEPQAQQPGAQGSDIHGQQKADLVKGQRKL